MNTFGQDWVNDFCICIKKLEHLESRESLWTKRDRFKSLYALTGRGCRILKEWTQCLNGNVIDRLFMVIIKSENERREQMLRLDTSQPALIQSPVMHQAKWLATYHLEIWMVQCAHFGAEFLDIVYVDEISFAQSK